MALARPIVLCISGHDPGGGAGIQADAETVAALGGHAACVIAAHTVQDSANVHRVESPSAALFEAQLDALLGDLRIAAVKLGLLGNAPQAASIARRLGALRVPVVLDPVLRAGGGADLADDALEQAVRTQLVPLADVLTPNAAEARRLAPGAADLDACGAALLRLGARNVLITGGDEPGDTVVNTWHRPARAPQRFSWPRLPGPFHGAGCTLAAAIATQLAHGAPLPAALQDAQAFVQRALQRAFPIGRGRPVPGRIA